MSERVRIVLGAILLSLMSAYFGLYVYSVTLPKRGSSDGFSASWDGTGQPRIVSVDADSPATGLVQVDDEMIAINGVNIRENPSILLGNEMPPGTRFTLTIRRAGQLQDVSILTVPHRGRIQFGTFYYVNLLFLLTAWAIFLLRPADKQAWLLALMLATFTGMIDNSPDNLPDGLRMFAGGINALGLLFFPIFVHFFLIFPEPSPLLRRLPRLETWIYLPCLLLVLPVLAPGRVSALAGLRLMNFQWFQYLIYVAIFIVVVFLAGGLICLTLNYRAASVGARRRLRVVMAGSAAGFFNLLVLIVGDSIGMKTVWPSLREWAGNALLFTLPLVPLSFVYAIVRHKVIPVSLMIRRGVRYVLVSRGSVLIEAVAVILTVTALLTYVFSRFNPPGIVIGLVSATVAIATWRLEGWFHNKYLAPVIDRKFFRQAYDSQKIMAELADSLRSTTDLQHLCEQVATRIQTALQTESVAVLLRDEATGDYLSGYSCEYSGNGQSTSCRGQFRLPAHGEFVAELKANSEPVEVDARLNGDAHSNSIEQAELREMKSSLLLPLMSKDGMPGIVSLGPRLGDLPFSREDKHLLISIAGPTAFAIENARLMERAIADARRRQELEAENEQRAKELEEARQLQLSMLPKTVPQLPHLEIAAYMKTATEVGGDYYDFHLSDNGELTIVVGDATGHGLKAGTLVTATKSLFNHLAETPDVTDFFYHSSRALKRMNMRSMFMAMTVARIKGYELTLSSAGMPATLIYRATSESIEEIPLTGIPLGSMPGYRYRQQQVPLDAGDVIVLMSDGFPERFNQEDEMLDYARVRELLAEAATDSPQEIIQRFLRAGEVWADGRPQDDDVTFVVVKVK